MAEIVADDDSANNPVVGSSGSPMDTSVAPLCQFWGLTHASVKM